MDERIPKKVIIDPGHGGADPGTSANGIVEKDYTLRISKYMADRLNELGIPNTLTRQGDETLSPSDRVNRIKGIYGTGNDVLVISNHLNSGGGDGAEIIYGLRNTDALSKLIANNMLLSGQNVRKYYQRRLPSNPSKDYYFIIRDTANNESILMEYAFVDSPKDDVNQIKNNYEGLAEAVVKSLAEYMGYKYTPPKNLGDNTYVVKKGDSLWSIASKYGLSVNKLKELNNLTSNLISIGQVLIISDNTSNIDNPSNDLVHIVEKGDTLYSIAKLYNTTVDKIKRLNNLSSNTLEIGQKLIVNKNASSMPQTNLFTYTVVKNDNLYNIAKAYNTTVNEIKNLNNLKTDVLQIGQKLQIPIVNEVKTYIVEKGDTLYSISRKFNTTVTDIISLNNLSTSNLTIGQKLLIP